LDGKGGGFGAGEIFARVDSGERDGMWRYIEVLTKDGELRVG
jgi:hypothetical protein